MNWDEYYSLYRERLEQMYYRRDNPLDSHFVYTTEFTAPFHVQALEDFLQPDIKIIEYEKLYLLYAEFGGLMPEEVQINVQDNRISLTGMYLIPANGLSPIYVDHTQSNTEFCEFQTRIYVPEKLESMCIRAEFNQCLELLLPKSKKKRFRILF